MRTKLTRAAIRALASKLGIVSDGRSDADLEVLVLRVLYERLSEHINSLHAAFARLVTGGDGSPETRGQQDTDRALFLGPFQTGEPFDPMVHLRLQGHETHTTTENEQV
jgi:hypothetical protein